MIVLKFRSLALIVASMVPAATAAGQAPPTIKEGLTRLSISLDPVSLYAALHDPRPAARSGAAAELAEMKDPGAAAEIRGAMSREQNREVLFAFAQSLDSLGDLAGSTWLERYCSTPAEAIENRIRAATALQLSGNYSCLPAMTEFLTSEDPAIQQSVLLYMLNIPTIQSNSPKTLGARLLAIANSGTTENLRNLAGKVILQIGDRETRSSYELHRSATQH